MHTINLIAQAIIGRDDCPELPKDTVKGVCCITGQESDCIDRSEIIGKSFTNHDLLKAPESGLISVDAYLSLGYKWERMSCWICDGKDFMRLKRTEFRPLILNGVPYDTWSAYITTSYKKHGALWAKVNNGKSGVWRFEMKDVDCRDLKKVNDIYNKLNTALNSGIGRTILETLDCSPFMINKIGINTWLDFERWARPIYMSGLYQFMCYLLPSQEERKNEEPTGISDDKQNTLF